jgi:iron-sulfur cluster repair protein YtfE (RIC family)
VPVLGDKDPNGLAGKATRRQGATMETSPNTFAEALYEAHTDLLRDLQELEKAVGSGAGEGPTELGTRLERVRMHLTDHFLFEEDGGYMAPVLREEPRFAPQIQELLAEHGQMAQALEALLQEVRTARTARDIPREHVRTWVGQVRHHETRENSLVQEAYYSSGATGD